MKNQFFGDVNDYRKYSLLRSLTDKGRISLAVCWMLTLNDSSKDGGRIDYLKDPRKWRHYDPGLFDSLKKPVDQCRRDVRCANNLALLPGARYYEKVIPDDKNERKQYFDGFWKEAKGCNLVFFDPDNGFEVPSMLCGRKGSSKYLYWNEFEMAFAQGFIILVYQHFPRKPRNEFISTVAGKIKSLAGDGSKIHVFRTAHVVFFLTLRESQESLIKPGLVHNWSKLDSRGKSIFLVRSPIECGA